MLSDWSDVPPWLSVEDTCILSGHDEETMRYMIFDGGVETRVVDGQHLIDAKSLEEVQKCLLLWVLGW
jgi:hypothetical protein